MKFAVIAAAAMLSANANATVYSAQDDGSQVGGPNLNSSAAEAALLADASTRGAVTTLTFDGDATQDANGYAYPGVTIATTNPQFGNGFTGISDGTNGPFYGYDVTASGSGKWLGFPGGNATFTFAAPTYAFGFYTTGTEKEFGADLTVTIDGVAHAAAVNISGGATYFGYTSASAFNTVTISRLGSDGPALDAWGVDGISYTLPGTAPAVPEPASWAMMIGGIGFAGGAMRRRRAIAVGLARAAA